jgi:hypothetical protein
VLIKKEEAHFIDVVAGGGGNTLAVLTHVC